MVARNTAFALLRRRGRLEPVPEDHELLEQPAPEPSLDGFHALDIHRALARCRIER